MDRFMLFVEVPYPPADNELAILRLVRAENTAEKLVQPDRISQDTVFAARREVNAVHVAEPVEKYIVDLVVATREPDRYGDELRKWIRVGASPRATIALDAASRARAWLHQRDFVSPEDVQAVAPACLGHRVHLSYEAEAAGKTRDTVIQEVLTRVAVA